MRRPFAALRSAASVVGRSGVLGPRPVRAVGAFIRCFAGHGGSLFTLAAWVAARTPDRLAVVEARESVTFADLVERSARRCELLERTLPGTARPRIALLGRNDATYVEWLLACGRLGAELVLLNPTMADEQLDAVGRRRRPDLVVADREFEPAAAAMGFRTMCTDVPCSDGTPAPDEGPIRRARRWRRRHGGSIILLTSGTTGPSTLVARRPAPSALLQVSFALVDRLDLRAGEPTLLTIPLLHGHGLATLGLTLAMGAPLHLADSTRGADLLDRIDRDRIAIVVLVPTILHRMLDAANGRGGPSGSVRAIVCGSAPLSPTLAERAMEAFGPVLYDLYGTSESGLVSLATPFDLRADPSTVGHVLPGVSIRIVGPDGADVAPGDTGRIIVFGRQVVGADGFDTGDLGHQDAAGRLFLAGRADHLLIRGGENVFPEAIEERVRHELDAVAECAVVAVPDDSEFGSELHLFVVLEPGRVDEPEALLELLAQRLPRTLRPTRLTIVQALPRNTSGEVVRRLLHEPSPPDD